MQKYEIFAIWQKNIFIMIYNIIVIAYGLGYVERKMVTERPPKNR